MKVIEELRAEAAGLAGERQRLEAEVRERGRLIEEQAGKIEALRGQLDEMRYDYMKDLCHLRE